VRSFAALRKEAGVFCGSFLRKGEAFAYVGLIQDLTDLQWWFRIQVSHVRIRVGGLLLLLLYIYIHIYIYTYIYICKGQTLNPKPQTLPAGRARGAARSAQLSPRGTRHLPEAGLSVPRRARPSRGGPVHPEAGLSVPRRAYPSRGGSIRPEAGLSVPRRAYPSRGGPICPEAGPSIPRRGDPATGSTGYWDSSDVEHYPLSAQRANNRPRKP
jgi:hypothetical protein